MTPEEHKPTLPMCKTWQVGIENGLYRNLVKVYASTQERAEAHIKTAYPHCTILSVEEMW